jgi:hypothetical protein
MLAFFKTFIFNVSQYVQVNHSNIFKLVCAANRIRKKAAVQAAQILKSDFFFKYFLNFRNSSNLCSLLNEELNITS